MASTPPVKKACDACHRRKVRCSGGQPCKNCGQASLECTYLAIPQKKGPKGSRAKVISEIRDTQQQQKQAIPHHAVKTSNSVASSHDTEINPFDFNTSPLSPIVNQRNLDLLSIQTVESCVSFFFNNLYPTMPIFSRQQLAALLMDYRNGPLEEYCLVLSLCSFIMIQPGMSLEGVQMPATYDEDPIVARSRYAAALLKEVHRIRKSIDYIDNPTITSIQISFFIFSSYFGLEKLNLSWYHLREASTLAHLLNMNEESLYKVGDPIENQYNRRFYWLLLLTERANAIQRHKPLSMLATIELPTVDRESQEAPFLHGFVYLASLFRLIDDEFMSLWNKAKSECSTSYLSQLQSQLADVIPPVLECTEIQAADVKITQHWLRCMVWQLSIANGYLSSSSPDVSMTFKYPIEIAKDLIRDLQSLSLQSMEVHGVGLIEKLFDMSCTLSDVITFVPIDSTNGQTQTPHDYLNQLLNLISRLRGGASRYVPLLMAKVAENVPNMQNPLTHMPHNLEAFMDGSSNADSTAQDLIDQQSILTPSTPSQSSYGGAIRPPPFGDASQQVPQQERLMFETYSPSVTSHSEPAITPPIFGMPGTPQGHYGGIHNAIAQPRSVPITSTNSKHDMWDGYHD